MPNDTNLEPGSGENTEVSFEDQYTEAAASLETQRTAYSDLEARYGALEQKSQVTPYSNEFVENINRMYQEEVDPETIRQYTSLQFSDLAGLTPMEKIEMKLKYENPRWSNDDIKYGIEEMLGSIPDKSKYEEEENLSAYEAILSKRDSQINRASIDAEEFLKGKKSSLASTKNEVAAEQEISRAELKTAWTPQINTLDLSQEFKFELDDKAIEGNYAFNFTPQIDAEQIQGIHDALIEQVVEAGLPLNQANLNEVNEKANNWIKSLYQEEFMKATVMDAIISTKEAMIKGQGSTGRIPEGSSTRANPKPVKQKLKLTPGRI